MVELVTYVALLDRAKRGYGVVFPDLPGCVSVGENFEDALAQGAEALAFHVEGMREAGERIPAPRTLEQIRAAKLDWIDWDDVVAAPIPLIEPLGQVRPATVTFDSAVLAAIDRYASRRKITRSAVLAEGAKLLMAARPAKSDGAKARKARKPGAKAIRRQRVA